MTKDAKTDRGARSNGTAEATSRGQGSLRRILREPRFARATARGCAHRTTRGHCIATASCCVGGDRPSRTAVRLATQATRVQRGARFGAEDYFSSAPKSTVIKAIAEAINPDEARKTGNGQGRCHPRWDALRRLIGVSTRWPRVLRRAPSHCGRAAPEISADTAGFCCLNGGPKQLNGCLPLNSGLNSSSHRAKGLMAAADGAEAAQ